MKKNHLSGGLFICLLLSCSALFAQVRVGLFAGPQFTSARYTVKDTKQPTDSKMGPMAGALLKVPFDNQLYFSPAVYYSLKGYSVTLQQSVFPPSAKALNNSTRIHTVEFAPLLQFDFSTKPSHFFIKGGPAADFALMGKEKFDTTTLGKSVERDMVFSFADYGRITASLNLHLGYEWANGFFVFAHYAHGVGSLNNADGGPKINHRVGGISLGYFLPAKRTAPR